MTHKVGELNFDKKLKAVKKRSQVKVNLQNLQAMKISQTKHARQKQPTKTNEKYSRRKKKRERQRKRATA